MHSKSEINSLQKMQISAKSTISNVSVAWLLLLHLRILLNCYWIIIIMTGCGRRAATQLSTWLVPFTYLGWKSRCDSFMRSVSWAIRPGRAHPSLSQTTAFSLEGSPWSQTSGCCSTAIIRRSDGWLPSRKPNSARRPFTLQEGSTAFWHVLFLILLCV